jgi:integrase
LSPRTIDLYRITLTHFGTFLGHVPTVDDLDDDVVSEYLLWRSQRPCRGRRVSPASVEKCRVQLLAVWRYGARKRLVREFPDVQAWKVPKRVKPAYTAEELDRLVGYARTLASNTKITGGKPGSWWWPTLILAAFQTGERKGGLLGLRWRDVDLSTRVVTFRAETRKGGREDIVRAITPALADELREQQGSPGDLVWPWCGNPTSIYPTVRRFCQRAGVPYLALHAIRRTSASLVARGGGDASAHLGHASTETTRDHYLVGEIVGAKSGLEFLPKIGGRDKQR